MRWRIRRSMDAHGFIVIDDLRPGRWSVRAASAKLPAFHRFEADTLWITLAPGARDSVALRAVPVERRMHMLDIGELTEADEEALRLYMRQQRPR